MRKITLVLAVAVIACSTVFLTGCQEQSMTAQDKKIKLLKNEKLELSRQIEELKKQIKIQKKLVVECEKQAAEKQSTNSDSMSKLLTIFAESEAKVQTLTEENKKLKSQLK